MDTKMTIRTSKILIIGVTGTLGYDLAIASLRASHPTFGLLRNSAFSDPNKSNKLRILSDAGVTLLKGSLQDEHSLIEAIKLVDVVICSIPSKQALDQKLLIRAIKLAGGVKYYFVGRKEYDYYRKNNTSWTEWKRTLCPQASLGLESCEWRKEYLICAISKTIAEILQRFIPSEFGLDPDKTRVSHLDNNFYKRKSEIRRLIEAENIPCTYVCCNFLMRYLLPSLVQPGLKSPPREKVTIYGDGTVKGVFVNQYDVAAFTISAVDDPHTLNKTLHLRPPGNVHSMNELVEIWETKIGKKLQRIYVAEDELLKKIKETPYPDNMEMVFIYCAFVKGDQTYFDVESSGGVEGTHLYPQIKYTTISDYLDTLS